MALKALLDIELDPAVEQRFLAQERAADIQRARFILIAAAPPLALFAFADPQFTQGFLLGIILLLRGVNFIAGIGLWIITYTRGPRFRAALRIWFISILFLLIVVRLTRPPLHFPATIWDFIALILIYTAPLSFKEKVLGASLMTLCELVIWTSEAAFADLPAATSLSIILALIISHLTGLFVSRDTLTSRRRQFLLVEEAERAQAETERAMAELKILQGIIPVCMYCKQVRNDEGAYEPIVDYVRAHSEAEFSHGICPDCGEAHHPGLFDEPEDAPTS